MHRVFRVKTDVTVEADDAEAAVASVSDFWQRACATTAHVTERGVLTSLCAEGATETFGEPAYSAAELLALTAIAGQVALLAVDALT